MQSVDYAGVTMCQGLAGLAVTAGGNNTVGWSAGVNYSIRGKMYNKALEANAVTTPTTDAATGQAFKPIIANQGTVFVWCADATGAFQVVQGEITDLDANGTFIDAPEFPLLPNTVCPVAYQLIRGGAALAAPFQFGVTNWNTGGITSAITPLASLPDRPQRA